MSANGIFAASDLAMMDDAADEIGYAADVQELWPPRVAPCSNCGAPVRLNTADLLVYDAAGGRHTCQEESL